MDSENPKQENAEAQGTYRPADQRGANPNAQLSPIGAELQPPPAPPGHETDKNKCREWPENLKLVMEGVGLIMLIAYTTFAALQWRANEKAANAAKIAADTVATQLEMNERPWVTVAITLEEPPHAHSPGPSLTFNND